MCDWAGEVFFHADLSPIFQVWVKAVVNPLDIALALRRTCKQAPLTIVFKPKEACELLKQRHERNGPGCARGS